MSRILLFMGCLSALSMNQRGEVIDRDLVVVRGVAGGEAFEEQFDAWTERFVAAGGEGGFATTILGQERDGANLAEIADWLDAQERTGERPLWMIFMGHGSFDGRFAKFNLRGPDLSSQRLGDILKPIERPMVLIFLHAASGPFLLHCGGNDRVLVTSTRSERQGDFSRYGEFLSLALTDLDADLDKDGSISLLESVLHASRELNRFYEGQNELVTEHALIDDNGDGRGMQANQFDGLEVVAGVASGSVPDGFRARQLKWRYDSEGLLIPKDLVDDRDFYERKVYEVREMKLNLSPWRYASELEEALLDLARAQREIDRHVESQGLEVSQ